MALVIKADHVNKRWFIQRCSISTQPKWSNIAGGLRIHSIRAPKTSPNGHAITYWLKARERGEIISFIAVWYSLTCTSLKRFSTADASSHISTVSRAIRPTILRRYRWSNTCSKRWCQACGSKAMLSMKWEIWFADASLTCWTRQLISWYIWLAVLLKEERRYKKGYLSLFPVRILLKNLCRSKRLSRKAAGGSLGVLSCHQ